jgi:hypothetical protein
MVTATNVFMILYVGSSGYEAHVRLAAGGVLTGHGFKDEASAREWVAKHAPNAKQAVDRLP